ncbi:uncharacterized protein [Apostichopus japonicus]|uniref:uncharacterized protein isoform X2 n=1 Tax=Stichopus japonicus TaxID=307972 RepID=UPI003AB8B91F
MDTATVLCIVGLLLRISVPTHSWDESDLSTASVVVKEGESAEISCMLKESNVAYFWLKGGSLENSTVVASFISGITINDPDDPFTVTENGTLIIKKVSRNDEGNYICRVSSEEISCHGDVFVFVQAVLQDFQLTIEYCEPENSCVISTESTKPTSLTCKATNASPSMKLKWFNGSREIKDNIEENSLTKGTSIEISSTIKDVYKAPSTLTCQAVDFKTSNDDGMFAHVQFRTSVAAADISPGWIVTAILFIIGFVILFLIVIFITVWPKLRNGNDVKTQNSEERESLLRAKQDLIGKNAALEEASQNKDDQIKMKNEEITKLKETLIKADAKEEIIHVTAEAKMKEDTREIQLRDQSIASIKAKVQKQDEELRVKDQTIASMKTTEQVNEKELNKCKQDMADLNAKVQKQDEELQVKDQIIASMKATEQVNGKELNKCKQGMADLNAKVQKQDKELQVKDQTIASMKDLEKKSLEINTQHKQAMEKEQHIKDTVKALENRENKLKNSYRELEKSERAFRAKKMGELHITKGFCGIRPLKGSKSLTVKIDGTQPSIAPHGKESKFSHIFNVGDNVRETFEKMSDFVENAIDGGQSCVIAFGNSRRHDQMKTMYGENSIIPLSFKRILERSKEMKHRTYKVSVQARLVHALEDSHGEIFIFKRKQDLVDKCINPTDLKAIHVNDEETMEQLLKDHMESQKETDTKHDCFVQFIINTTEDGQETARTGKITFATLFGLEMIKKCFLETSKTKLTQYLSKIIRDPNSKSLLIVHLDEEKDDLKEILKVTGQITEESTKKSKNIRK